MAPSDKACLCRGSINIDEFYNLPHIVRPGETIASTGFSRKTGGKGANQAFACGRAGGKVVLDGNIGADGTAARDFIASGGVDVSRVHILDGEVTGRAIIQRAADGENSIVLHAGANAKRDESAPNLDGFSHVLLQNEIPLADTLAYLREAGKRGLTTIYNPSPMPAIDELQVFPWDCLSFLVVNEGELEGILDAFGGLKVDTSLNVADASVLRMKALRKAKGFNPKIVIVTTIGPDGVLALIPEEDEVQRFPAVPATKVVDTTGAGDTFAGYFTAMIMERGDDAKLKDIFPTCITASTIAVENAGAMESIPARKDVDARVKTL